MASYRRAESFLRSVEERYRSFIIKHPGIIKERISNTHKKIIKGNLESGDRYFQSGVIVRALEEMIAFMEESRFDEDQKAIEHLASALKILGKKRYLLFLNKNRVVRSIETAEICLSNNIRFEPGYAYLAIDTDEDYSGVAEIKVNGSYLGRTPLEWKKIPAGLNRLDVQNGRLEYNFKEKNLYSVTAYPAIPLLGSAEGLAGYQAPPGKPVPLEEWEEVKRRKFNWDTFGESVVVMSAAGGLFGAAFGVFEAAEAEVGEEVRVAVLCTIGGTVAGITIGAVLGIDLGFREGKEYVKRKKISRNININKKRLAGWKKERQRIEENNLTILNKANQEISNKNQNRGFVGITLLKSGKTDVIQLPAP